MPYCNLYGHGNTSSLQSSCAWKQLFSCLATHTKDVTASVIDGERSGKFEQAMMIFIDNDKYYEETWSITWPMLSIVDGNRHNACLFSSIRNHIVMPTSGGHLTNRCCCTQGVILKYLIHYKVAIVSIFLR